jgi:hypothetical protein
MFRRRIAEAFRRSSKSPRARQAAGRQGQQPFRPLKLQGLIDRQENGKRHGYAADPQQVRYEITETEITLRFTARETAVAVVICIPRRGND